MVYSLIGIYLFIKIFRVIILILNIKKVKELMNKIKKVMEEVSKEVKLVSLMVKYPAFNRCDIGSNPIQGKKRNKRL